MNTHPHAEIESAFRAFSSSVAAGDVAAFEALCCRDVPPQRDLFERNAAYVKSRGASLVLRRVETEAEVARVEFDVKSGGTTEQGHVVFTREPEGWRIRGL